PRHHRVSQRESRPRRSTFPQRLPDQEGKELWRLEGSLLCAGWTSAQVL
ncbi:hypothetical protein BN1708_020093, partial [Verticillium longisporum]